MVMVSVADAEKSFPALLRKVIAGEEVLIFSDDKLVAVVRHPSASPEKKPRVPGSMIGQVTLTPEFDEPLPEEITREFGAVIW